MERIQLAVCYTCKLKHLAAPGSDEAVEFFKRHRNHKVEMVSPDPILVKLRKMFGVDLFREIHRRAEKIIEIQKLGVLGFADNANVKEAFGTATAFTKTNANLASSAAAGWQSNSIDNSANLYLDALVSWELAAVNTAPASSKAIYCFGFALIEGTTAYTSTGDATPSGTEGTLTYPDVTTLPVVAPTLGVIAYPVQNRAINGGPFSVAACFNGTLPNSKWAVGMVNHSGMTLNVTNIYYVEKYLTVV